MRILLVDDESKTAAYLRKGLAEKRVCGGCGQSRAERIDLAHKAELRSDGGQHHVGSTRWLSTGMQEWPYFPNYAVPGNILRCCSWRLAGVRMVRCVGFSDFLHSNPFGR